MVVQLDRLPSYLGRLVNQRFFTSGSPRQGEPQGALILTFSDSRQPTANKRAESAVKAGSFCPRRTRKSFTSKVNEKITPSAGPDRIRFLTREAPCLAGGFSCAILRPGRTQIAASRR